MEYFRQGNSQFIDEDYDEAVEVSILSMFLAFLNVFIQSYTSAIKGMPNAATPLLNRGTCYLKLKKFYEALEDFTAAIALNADLELAYYRKG